MHDEPSVCLEMHDANRECSTEDKITGNMEKNSINLGKAKRFDYVVTLLCYKKLKVFVITLTIMLWVKMITEMCPDALYFVVLLLGQTILVTKGRSQ